MSEIGPVVDMSRSPHAKLRPVPLSAVELTDAFWEPRRRINRDITLPTQLKQCEDTGRIDNFRIASGRKQGEFTGIYFNDSDVYKWAEAAAYSIAVDPDSDLEAKLDAVIDEIAAAQQPDGYLNTYFMFDREKDRYTNLKDMHELYCGGHLIQAAVAHFRATGKRSFLDVACRLAENWYSHFGPGKRDAACGHEEAEMALVELYRATGEARYLELGKRMIDARGQGETGLFGKSAYHQDDKPFTSQKEMVGHAVRHLYLCCGAADVLAETGDAHYSYALNALWVNFTQCKMYVTGGAGARYEGEAFGENYELPNERAYAETCAAIGSVMWNWRMLNITGESKYADLMERTLYNAVLPGLSLDGLRYFYENPLADNGKKRRQEWFGCACCPPNVARLLASLPGYFYITRENDIYVHLYASNTATITLPNGGKVVLEQKTNYPWDGAIEITIKEAPAEPFGLIVRSPEWSKANSWVRYSDEEERTFLINGEPLESGGLANADAEDEDAEPFNDYWRIRRQWRAGDVLRLNFTMRTLNLRSNSNVASNRGQIALQRGPIIYCLEKTDNTEPMSEIGLLKYVALEPEWRPELLGGVNVLRGSGVQMNGDDAYDDLFFNIGTTRQHAPSPLQVTAIPYYAWANREPGAMRIWMPAE